MISKASQNNSKSTAEHIKDELRILQQVDHPNIMKVYEILEDKANYYIITELLEGGQLKDKYTSKVPMDERDIARIVL